MNSLNQAASRTRMQSAVSAEEAGAIAVDAYLYFYPLLSMDVTRRQATNMEPGREVGKGPMNMFVHRGEYPSAGFKGVVRPNFDTLYSTAWLDLRREPLVVSAPDTGGRYYLMPMLDMWTDVFASPGWRTTGTDKGDYLLTAPGWQGTVPEGMDHIPAPTPYVWIICRVKTDGPPDFDAVHRIQAGFEVAPLSLWGRPAAPATLTIDPTTDMRTPPKTQVDTMEAEDYFTYAAELLKLHAPHITDQPIIARLRRIGIEPGKSFDVNSLDPVVREAVSQAPAAAQETMRWKRATLARVANGWTMNTDTMGVYGNFYLKRAIIAQMGLGANPPEDAIYPLNLYDEGGRALDGAHKYTIHFEEGRTPPVDAFWSITLYDDDGFQIPNELNRFALSSWMPFKSNGDGSLDLYFQHEYPGPEREANWLPAPASAFNLTMRLYAPRSEALTGRWDPPAVKQMP